jgi:hypothetical protein
VAKAVALVRRVAPDEAPKSKKPRFLANERTPGLFLRAAAIAAVTVTLTIIITLGVAWIRFINYAPLRLGPRALRTPATMRAPRPARAVAAPAWQSATVVLPVATSDPNAPPVPWPAPLLAEESSRGKPFDVWARAQRLVADGVDMTLSQVTVTHAMLDRIESEIAAVRFTTVTYSGRTIGLRLTDLPDSSPLRLLGVQRGDVIFSFNGIGIGEPDRLSDAFIRTPNPYVAVIEILRAGREVGLQISSPDERGPSRNAPRH